ncbi:MAG: ATP synthase F1 subunit epsilon [Clostridia bacterium]|nr:ATP synthase F1 subunit epsilon [Clostridia bacterium]
MNSFPLKVVTPDGLLFDGQAEQLTVRTTSGDIGILASHVNCVAPLGMGTAMILTEGKRRYAACIGGILSVVNGEVRLVPTTFEWADSIDKERAAASAARARDVLARKDSSAMEIKLAEARLKRALVRESVANQH